MDEDFDNICRSCLNRTSLACIFETNFEGTSLFDILTQLSLMQAEHDNQLPSKLCESCISEVVRFHKFKINFLKSETKLRDKMREAEIVNTIVIEDDGDEIHVPLENNAEVIKLSDESDCDSEKQGTEVSLFDFSSDSEDELLRKKYNIPPEMEIQVINTKDFKKNLEKNEYAFNIKLDGGVQVMTEQELKTPKTYLCMCGKIFTKHPEYLKHKKEFNHLRRVTTCEICGKMVHKYRLTMHMRKHTKEKPYACELCPLRFSIRGNYTRHFRIHTGEKPYVCDICGQGFIQSPTLNAHRLAHMGLKPFKCDLCDKCFTIKAYLNKHQMQQHGIEIEKMERESNKAETPKVACPICGKLCAESRVQFHINCHNRRNFLCGACGKQFVTKHGLDIHSLIHTGEKPHSCDICSKSFRQLASLYQHKLIHSGEKKNVCHFCGRTFRQTSHLKTHLTTHTGEKPHECKFCGKRFSIRKNMTVHMRIHTGERPWVCDVCSKRFYESNALKKHKNVHRKEKA